jgi:ATP adenylyltransferase
MAKKKVSQRKPTLKVAKRPRKSLTKAFTEIWPQERDWMARPERLRYVRKMVEVQGCVFCSAQKRPGDPESLCVYKNDWAMVCLNKYPYNSGHILVLPTRHCGDLTELNESEYLEVQILLRRVVDVVKKEYGVTGINVGLNMGSVAGAGLPDHLHWHVIPRWAGDTNFFPLIAETKVVPESLEQTFERYRRHFEESGENK